MPIQKTFIPRLRRLREPYLIQLGTIKSKLDSQQKGIDQLIDFKYMGSSEFEFGALGDSLKVIRDNFDKYGLFVDVELGTTYFCYQEWEEQINKHIKGLSKGEYQLQEPCDYEYLYRDSPFAPNKKISDFWWDIDNHYMWWLTDKHFEEQFKVLIKPD